jgi:putative transposase
MGLMGNKRLIENASIDQSHLDRTNWPNVLIENLSEKNQKIYLNRKKAIDMYIDGDISIKSITEKTGIKKQNLVKMVKRCLEFDSEGIIYGYKALIPYYRIEDYKRYKDYNGFNNVEETRFSGAFNAMLEEFPDIEEMVKTYFLNRKKRDLNEPIIRIKYLHRKFISLCKSLGLDPIKGDYPFNTEDMGRRSLYRYAQQLEREFAGEAIYRYGNDAKTQLYNTGIGDKDKITIRPFQRVEFDAHKIDAVFVVEFETPEGDKFTEVLHRVWLLAIVDVATRTILAYDLCFNREISAQHVLRCIRKAIVPWTPMEFTIPGLEYPKEGGFPSEVIPETQFAVWDEIAFDNAKANLANKVKEKLIKTIGCTVNTGPVATPQRRPIIEVFFHTLEENCFHRLPNTTGNNPKDPRKRDPEKIAIKYEITVEELKQIAEIAIYSRNGTPQHGTNYLTPLEVMNQRIITRKMEPRILEEDLRDEINLLSFTAEVTVSGNIKKGIRPYIYYMGVEYRSEVLSNSWHLIKKKLKVVINSEDLRFFNVFLPNGAEIGVVRAKGKWGIRKHSLQIRQQINKLLRKKLIRVSSEDCPLEVLFQYLKTKSKNNKSARNQLVSLEQDIMNNIGEKEVVSKSNINESEDSTFDEPHTLTEFKEDNKKSFEKNYNYLKKKIYSEHASRKTFN